MPGLRQQDPICRDSEQRVVGLSHKVPSSAGQAEAASPEGSQQQQAGGCTVGRLDHTRRAAPDLQEDEITCRHWDLGDRSLEVSPWGDTSTSLYRPKQAEAAPRRAVGSSTYFLPKGSSVSAARRLGTPCQEGKAQGAFPPHQHRSTGTRLLLRAGRHCRRFPLRDWEEPNTKTLSCTPRASCHPPASAWVTLTESSQRCGLVVDMF